MKLRRRDHSVPELNMAAMPDLIFTVLFFFMIVTHMRQNTVDVSYQVPQGTNLVKVTNKAALIHVYVGKDRQTGDYKVQIGDLITPYDQLSRALRDERNNLPGDQIAQAQVSLLADRDVPMYIINKVKMALREAHVLKINYNGEALPQETTTK